MNAHEYYIGIDIGSVSIKIALFASLEYKQAFENLVIQQTEYFQYCDDISISQDHQSVLLLSRYRRIKGEPVLAAFDLLGKFLAALNPVGELKIAITGSGGKALANVFSAAYVNEFQVIAQGISLLQPDARTILEIGGDTSKYIKLEPDPENGKLTIADYEKNGDCAAGTGSFMDQQSSRLLYDIEDVGDVVMQADKSAAIAGRCSVFAKSDMIHAQQKGFKPPEILKGLCEAVVRNFRGTITKGKDIIPPVAFIGGVAANKGVTLALQSVFKLTDSQLIIPKYFKWIEAIGAALIAGHEQKSISAVALLDIISENRQLNRSFTTSDPISSDKLVLLRDRVKRYQLPENEKVRCYLGIDIGSVTTKLVLIDENEDLVHEIYTRTQARPIEVVSEGLKQIEHAFGDKVTIIGTGTTGSGRELIGELIGADIIKDEITAHKTGAMNVSEKLTGKKVDTIFDIGGQDSKYISIENGVVVDFTMNEACAAGTGSFLEEQAEKLGINIKREFADLALRSTTPVRLGERCTVFMEKDITPFLNQGASKQDITAGLAYSIVYNYLNRVVRGRKIGDVIYFQGGTAYNDAVAAAFSTILNKEIIVPPHNGVIGAIGAAMLAKQKIEPGNVSTSFRGFDVSRINYSIRNFTCKGCTNYCDIQEFTVEEKKTYWGDKCSDRYRKTSKAVRKPVIEDLFKFRDQLLMDDYVQKENGLPTIGLTRSMYFYDRFPFWNTYFRELGVNLVLSDETNRQIIYSGIESQVAEPCFPIGVAHGHIQNLIDKSVDYIFQPNVVNSETNYPQTHSFLCPWGQTLCFVIMQTPSFKNYRDKIIYPNVRFAEGKETVTRELQQVAKKLGFKNSKNNRAVERGFEAQQKFNKSLLEKGRQVLEIITEKNELAIVLLGRPYNIYDPMINLNVPKKLRDNYGVNVIPIDFLSDDNIDIYDIHENMFWNYGRRILQVSKLTRRYPNLHLIYITNFKCGPDSYIKHYVRDASQSPYLTLQFDGHGNDAGIMTRCEAYLDSKGFFNHLE